MRFRLQSDDLQAVLLKCYDLGAMNKQETLDYRVRIFRNSSDGVTRWKGYVVTIPAITAEADSREDVLENLSQQLGEAVTTSEIVKLPGPFPEAVVYGDGSELDQKLRTNGWKHYGLFADDPGALELFDEIERQRDQQTIGGE